MSIWCTNELIDDRKQLGLIIGIWISGWRVNWYDIARAVNYAHVITHVVNPNDMARVNKDIRGCINRHYLLLTLVMTQRKSFS